MKLPVLRFRQGRLAWFTSYAVIILLSIVINMVGYSVSVRVIEEEVEKSNYSSVDNMKNLYDNYLEELMHTAYNILASRAVEKMAAGTISTDAERTQNAMAIIQDVANAAYSQRIISQCVVIARDVDICINKTSMANRDLMYDSYFQKFYSTQQQWLDDIFGVKINEYKVLQDKENKNILCLVMNFPYEKSNRSVFIELAPILDSLLGQMKLESGEQYFITAQNGQTLFSTGNSDVEQYASQEEGVQKINGKRYVVTRINSDVTNLTYVHIVPSSIYQRKIHLVQVAFILGYLACILIGGLLALWFSKINERMKREMEEKLRRQSEMMRNATLAQILENRQPVDMSRLAEHNLILQGNAFLVVSFDFSRSVGGEDLLPEEYKTICDCLEAKFADQGMKAYFCTIQDRCSGVLCLEPGVKEEDVERAIEAMQQFFAETNLSFICAISKLLEELSSLGEAYLETLQALDLTFLGEKSKILRCSKIMREYVSYEYSLETEKRLINLLILGKREQAYQVIDELFDYNLNVRKITLGMLRILTSEVSNSLMKAEMQISKKEAISFKGLYTFSVQINNIRNTDNAKEILLYYIDQLCELSLKNMENVSEPSADSRYNKIIQYVEQEYKNYNLNVNLIAEVFGFTPNWLSRYFKEKVGEGLAEYIVKYRLQKAKELIAQGVTIAAAAEETGFVNDGIFRRAFKKHEGITPTQYRQLLHVEEG